MPHPTRHPTPHSIHRISRARTRAGALEVVAAAATQAHADAVTVRCILCVAEDGAANAAERQPDAVRQRPRVHVGLARRSLTLLLLPLLPSSCASSFIDIAPRPRPLILYPLSFII